MNFAAADDFASIGTPSSIGHLASTVPTSFDAGFVFYQSAGDLGAVPGPGDFALETRVNVEMQGNRSNGVAHVQQNVRFHDGFGDSGVVVQDFLVAFDTTHFLRSSDGGMTEQAFFRQTFDENVWSYNLYHATGPNAGERVELDSGFGVRTAGGEYGWAGYHGMWVPEGVTISDGDTVFRDVFDEVGEEVPYTVVQGPGKLIRYTTEELPLASLGGETFQAWTWDDMAMQSVLYVVEYDTMSASFFRTGTVNPETGEITDLVPDEMIDTSIEGYLGLWSDSLGGSVSYVDGASFVTYYGQEFVGPCDPVLTSGTLDLYGLVNASFPGFFTAGVTYYAQYWYRDVLCGPPPAPCPTVCGTNANFTNAVTWTATP